MKHLPLAVLTFIVTLCSSCAKGTSPGNAGSTAPTNLVFTATVSSDNNGSVSFTATATNANSYEFDFGNGIFQTSATGTVVYKYPASGNYTANVVAKNIGGQVTKSTQVAVVISAAAALVWSDEFDVAGAPNTAKWGYDLAVAAGAITSCSIIPTG